MSKHDTKDSGIPTRAIHEGYLAMQQAHRQFRHARSTPGTDEEVAHQQFQDTVLTFYELIRPHLKRKGGMSKFWDGKLPRYPNQPWESYDHAVRYCQEYGIAVWGCQKHIETAAKPGGADQLAAIADGGGSVEQSLEHWHDQLGLGDFQRVVAVQEEKSILVWIELRAIAGLKQLDRWDTQTISKRESGNGFMAGEVVTADRYRYVDAWKLTAAKRLLAEAADKMQLLSHIEVDHKDGAIVGFDMSREDATAGYRNAEYGGSPEI